MTLAIDEVIDRMESMMHGEYDALTILYDAMGVPFWTRFERGDAGPWESEDEYGSHTMDVMTGVGHTPSGSPVIRPREPQQTQNFTPTDPAARLLGYAIVNPVARCTRQRLRNRSPNFPSVSLNVYNVREHEYQTVREYQEYLEERRHTTRFEYAVDLFGMEVTTTATHQSGDEWEYTVIHENPEDGSPETLETRHYHYADAPEFLGHRGHHFGGRVVDYLEHERPPIEFEVPKDPGAFDALAPT